MSVVPAAAIDAPKAPSLLAEATNAARAAARGWLAVALRADLPRQPLPAQVRQLRRQYRRGTYRGDNGGSHGGA